MVTPTELARSGSSAYIYQDRMYVIRGTDKNGSTDDIWCLDLSINITFPEPIKSQF